MTHPRKSNVPETVSSRVKSRVIVTGAAGMLGSAALRMAPADVATVGSTRSGGKPVAKKVVSKSVAKKVVSKSFAKKVVRKPVAKKVVSKVAAKKAVSRSVVKKVVAKKVVRKSVAKKVVRKKKVAEAEA